MKNFLCPMLTYLLSFTPLTQKKEPLHIPKDIVTHVAQFLDSPKDLMNLALVNKNFYVGVKQLVRSKKFFNKCPNSQALLLALQAQLSQHDEEVIFTQNFEDVCNALNIKNSKTLSPADYLKILDYLIANLNAQTFAARQPTTHKKLVCHSHMIIKALATILPSDPQALQNILDTIQAESIKFEHDIFGGITAYRHIRCNKKLRNRLRNNKKTTLRTYYLSLACKKNKTFKDKKSLQLLINHWKAITKYSDDHLPEFIGTSLSYFTDTTRATLKTRQLINETLQHSKQYGPKKRKEFIKKIINFYIDSHNHAPIKHLGTHISIQELITMIIKTIPDLVSNYKEMALERHKKVTIKGYNAFNKEILKIYETFITKKIIPWYYKQQKSSDAKKKVAAQALIIRLYKACQKSTLNKKLTTALLSKIQFVKK